MILDGSLYALIFEPGSPRPLAEMGRILAARLGVAHADAVARVRYGEGLIAEDLSEPEADGLAEDLRVLGVRSRRVPAESWGIVPRGYHVRAIEFLEDTILARVHDDEDLVIPTEEAFGIDVYIFAPHLERPDRADDGGKTSRGRRGRWLWEEHRAPGGGADRWGSGGRYARAARARASELIVPGEAPVLSRRAQDLLERLGESELESADLRATLYCREPTGPLRIRKDRFDYSCLGDRKREHSVDNFIELLDALVVRLPGALNGDAVRRFLRSLDPADILRTKEEETENLHRWVYQWARIDAEGPEEEGE